MMEWKPIEQAPEGETVLVYYPPMDRGRGRLMSPAFMSVERIPVPTPRKPSHFQPLPPPPED